MNNFQHEHDALAEHLFRQSSGKITTKLCRKFGNEYIDEITDSVYEAFEAALKTWKFKGIPDFPEAWLYRVAHNKLINVLKKNNRIVSLENKDYHSNEILLSAEDDTLSMIVHCLSLDIDERSKLMLTLYLCSGFGIPELAKAFIMSHDNAKKIIYRAKEKVKLQPWQWKGEEWQEQQAMPLLSILYLMFNEGYKTTRGSSGINRDICLEAVRLTLLHVETHIENRGMGNALLAIMFFHLSRFDSRLGSEGEWLTLEEQDRSSWSQPMIAKAFYFLSMIEQPKTLNKFYLEALILSHHARAKTWTDTDWQAIVNLYKHLEKIEKDVYVQLNRIIAQSYINPIESCLNEIIALQTDVEPYLYHMTMAELHRRSAKSKMALDHYQTAMNFIQSDSDRLFIEKRLKIIKAT